MIFTSPIYEVEFKENVKPAIDADNLVFATKLETPNIMIELILILVLDKFKVLLSFAMISEGLAFELLNYKDSEPTKKISYEKVSHMMRGENILIELPNGLNVND